MPTDDEVELSDELKRASQQAHAQFSQGIDSLLSQQFLADGFPDKLCHYTDFRGLQGILETHALWATYTQTLNDGSEQAFGLKVVNDYIARFPDGGSMKTFRASMDLGLQHHFACCFCETSELLSMWIAYSRRAGGYCLEFDGANGMLRCSFPPFTRLPFKLIYGDVMPGSMESMLRYSCEFAQSGDVEATVASAWVKLLSLAFKHPAFKDEQERRIIIPQPPVSTMKFRAGAFDIKPYVELRPTFEDGTCRLPLKRILIGPTLRQDKTMIEIVELMLESYGYRNIPVVSCGIPYQL